MKSLRRLSNRTSSVKRGWGSLARFGTVRDNMQMARFEHIRHKPPTSLNRPRGMQIVLAPMRSGVNLSRIVRLAAVPALAELRR